MPCIVEVLTWVPAYQQHQRHATVVALELSREEVCFKDADGEASIKGEEASIVGEEAFPMGEEGYSVGEEVTLKGEEISSRGNEVSIKGEHTFCMVTEVFANVGFTSLGWSGSEISSIARVSPAVVVIGNLPPAQVPQPSSSWASLCNCRVSLLTHSSCW